MKSAKRGSANLVGVRGLLGGGVLVWGRGEGEGVDGWMSGCRGGGQGRGWGWEEGGRRTWR